MLVRFMSNSKSSKMKYVEWYAKYIWPLHRRFVGRYLSQRCSQCIVSEKYVSLDHGVCPMCASRDDKDQCNAASDVKGGGTEHLSEEFHNLMCEAQGRGRQQYDVLVLLSGGKDSAFLLYHLRECYPGLRILAYTVDNGFFSEVARRNVEHIVKKMQVDHIVYRPSLSLFRKGFHYAINHLGSHGCSEVVDRLDGDLLHDLARHMAAQKEIPFLLSGVSWAQVEQIFQVEHYEMPRDRELSERTHTGPICIADVFDVEERKNWWQPNAYGSDQVARFLFPFYAWRYDEEYIKQFVMEHGLINKNDISPLVTNNDLIPVMGLIDIAKIGYSSFEIEFAQMVREGRADRRLWLNIFEINEYAGKTGWMLGPEVKETLKRLQIDSVEMGLPI